MSDSGKDHYGIGAVARLTGLSDHAIRVWERRYGAVVAARSASGRRLYVPADVEKLRLLKLLTDRGVAIGTIAGDSSEQLKQRLAGMSDLMHRPSLAATRVALFGSFLVSRVRAAAPWPGALSFVIAESDAAQFAAALAPGAADALVLELPTVIPATRERIDALRAKSGAACCIVVYTFARSADVEALAAEGVVLLRAPIGFEELGNALVGQRFAPLAAKPAENPADAASCEDPARALPPPRRFSTEQLIRLSRIETAVDCECPQHLAQLAADLSAFEVYSASCASRDDDDRALHEYLRGSSARARAEIEEALARVVAAEGISV